MRSVSLSAVVLEEVPLQHFTVMAILNKKHSSASYRNLVFNSKLISNMKTQLIFVFSLLTIFTFAQTNMIANGSFERTNPSVLATINDCDRILPNHLTNDTATSLFRCWEYYYDPQGVDLSHISHTGLVWGIAPGIFHIGTGNSYLQNSTYDIYETNSTVDKRRILCSGDADIYGLQLQDDPQSSNDGFDLSPPNTKFANNVNGEHGSNYIAMLDYRVPYERNNIPGLRSKLKHPLSEDVEYTFKISASKMNEISSIVSNENWGGTSDPKIWVYMVNENNGQKQKILEVSLTTDSWTTYQANFTADNASSHIFISGDVLDEVGIGNNPRITGCFIDNLKLYETCETPQNECLNVNYRRDVLDASLDEVELFSNHPNNHPIPGSNDPDGYIRTIRAENLDHVQRFEMKIYGPDNMGLVRTIDHWYPNSTYVWDGNDDGGNPMPESYGVSQTSKYKAVINAVSNECYHTSFIDQKYFHLRRQYTTFNPSPLISNNTVIDVGVVPAIHNLDGVRELRIILSSNGATVYDNTFIDPQSSIYLTTNMGNTAGVPVITPGQYGVQLLCTNNCEIETEFSGAVNILDYSNYLGTTSTLFDWQSVTKTDISCPYDYEYLQNFQPPQDCCEGSLYLENVDINGAWTVNILNNIEIGNGTSFSPFYENTLNAGGEINIVPGATGVDIYENTNLNSGFYGCTGCRLSGEEDSENDGMNVSDEEKQTDEIVQHFKLAPNPIQSGDEFSILDNESTLNVENFEVYLFDAFGRKIECEGKVRRAKGSKSITVKSDQKLSSGLYHVNFRSGQFYQHFELIVQ
mmetsp:Transcript_26906/g.35980  ORF Transcript_26906/g.35980 Transcript_26906/m.35980 type:complete len:807 (-) Transcript_26906:28-2448(-)